MTPHTSVALVIGALLVAHVPGQEPIRDVAARRILMLENTQPDLDGLRAAVRSQDAALCAELGERLAREARDARADLASAVTDLGGRVVEHFWIIDACVVEVPDAATRHLRELPHVVAVWEDSPRAPGGMPMPIKTSTNASNHGTDSVQARGIRGAGVTIAVVDSGLDERMGALTRPHRTFFVNGDPNNTTGGGIGGSRILANAQVGAFPADDPIDHGTRVGGVAAGARWNTTAGSDDGHAPDAKLVGYALVDLANGFSTVTTITRAWQRCTLEAAQYGTRVAVTSYEGYFDPLAPDQEAVDACAEIADIAIAVMAGNNPLSQQFYASATNVLAVGSVQHNTHVVSSFSARGPLDHATGVTRVYPQLVANGEAIEMPSANTETTNVVRNGTSYSAPQVAGAAVLYRSVAANSTADETRAAILATVDDGRGPPQNTSSSIGNGYLRVDRLIDLAQGNLGGLVTTGRATAIHPVWTTSFQANQGEVFAAAIAFSRRIVAAKTWANLDIIVSQNGEPLAQSEGIADTTERIAFRVPSSGRVDVAVVARAFEVGTIDQQFGIAIARAPSPLISAYGAGCAGARAPSTVQEIEPMGLPGFGNTSSDQLIGGLPHRTQQWIQTDAPSAAFTIRGLALRHDEAAASAPWTKSWVELDATFDLTMLDPTSMTTTFAQNLGRLQTQVIARKRFVLPSIAAPNSQSNDFKVVLPLDVAFERQYDPVGPNPVNIMDLIVDIRTYATSAGAQPLRYPLDALSGSPWARTLFANNPNATTGTVTTGAATVIGLVRDLGATVVPQLDVAGVPALGANYTLQVSNAPPTMPVFFGIGFSQTAFGGLTLPFDLAPIGAPSCFLLSSLDGLLSGATGVTGTASTQIGVPTNAAMRGRSVFHQVLVSDPGANAAGLTTTAAIRATIGQ